MSSEPDRPTLAHTTTHVADGLARLTQRWRGLPAVEALLSSHLVEVQEIEDALWSILALTLETATGAHLDQIGALLGEPRVTLGDTKYQLVMQARILANRSSGTLPELAEILRLFAGVGYTLDEVFPAGVLATLENFSSTLPSERMGSVLRRAVAGGVGMQLVVPASTEVPFRFASADEPEAAVSIGFGIVSPSVGGHLAGVY